MKVRISIQVKTIEKKKNNKENHKLNSILDDIRNEEKLINILNMEENPKKNN